MSGKRRSKAARTARAVRGAIASTTSGPCARLILAASTPPSHAGRLPHASPARGRASPHPQSGPRRQFGVGRLWASRVVALCDMRARVADHDHQPHQPRPALWVPGLRGKGHSSRAIAGGPPSRSVRRVCMARATASLIRLRSAPVRGGRPGGAVGPAGTSGRPASNRAPSTAPAAQHATPRSSRSRSAPAASSCPNGTPPATTT